MTATAVELQTLSLFDGCTAEELRPVADAVLGTREAVAGEAICAEGESADRWWIVVDGMADVTVAGLYTATIGPGETIGELALLDGEPRGATVTAVTDMRLHEVDGGLFVDALGASPGLAIALLRELAVRLRATNLRPSLPDKAKVTTLPPRTPGPPSSVRPTVAPTEFDPRMPGFLEDRLAYVAALREAAAVHWSEAIASFVVTRYEDVHRLARSRSLVGSIITQDRSYLTDPTGTAKPRPGHRMMIRRDGDDHLRLRRLVSKVFTPRAVSRWQERADSIVEGLLVAASECPAIDVIADYALPLPAQVITEMLGMPHGDTPQLRSWSRTLTTGLDPFVTTEQQELAGQAGQAMTAYLEEVVAEKRSCPADDILTALLHAEEGGEVLGDRAVVAQVMMLYIAGHETTLNLIGNGVTHLLRFSEQRDRLISEPSLDANAVEEVLRFESPAQLTRRITLEPLEVDGVRIPADSHVTLLLASANHDPRKWGPTADALDIARPGANEHVSFGGGAHFCLGAALARLEAKIALPRLMRRFPRMVPAYDEPRWMNRLTLRGVETLPVSLRG